MNVTLTFTFSFFLQGISQIGKPIRIIGYSRVGMACTPNTVFTNDSFEVTLPNDAEFGETFAMCMQLIFGDCVGMASRDFTSKSVILTHILTCCVSIPVPDQNIASQNGRIVSDTSFTATMNLPLTEYQPDQLLVIVSISPNDTAPVVADFPASYQYTVMFSGLMTGTSYVYTVWVVCRSDMTDVVEPFVEDFIIAARRK